MQDTRDAPIVRRLLAVTRDCHGAFVEAARAVTSPHLAALFERRAERHAHFATYLEEQLPAKRTMLGIPAHAPHRTVRLMDDGEPATERAPHVLLSDCIRGLAIAILEFGRVYGPSMAATQRNSLERLHDQMRWSRDELIELRRTDRAQRRKQSTDDPGR